LPNADPQTYEVYAGVPGFAPGPGNLVYKGPSTNGRFDRIGDTLLMPADTAVVIPEYVVRILASDADGPATAGISDESNAVSPRRADNYDISAMYAYFGEIEVSQLKAGTMDASIVLAAEIFTAASGARAGISNTDGFVSWGPPTTAYPSGEPILSVPILPDENGQIAAFLRAALQATSLTVDDFLALRGTNNEFSKASITTLATGTTSPQSPPQPSIDWELKPRSFGSSLTYAGQGWAKDGGNYWVASSFFGGQLDVFTENTGSFDWVSGYSLGSSIRPTGCTVLGSYVYVLCRDESRAVGGFGKFYVRKYDKGTGVFNSEWQYQPSGTTTGLYSDFDPTIGTDGTDIIIVQCPNSSGSGLDPVIRRYSPTGALIGTIATGLSIADHYTSVSVGTFDLGTTVYYLTRRNGPSAYAIAGGAHDTTRTFPLPVSSGNHGTLWDGTIFKTLTDSGVYLHSQHMWTATTSDRWWVAHSWYDSNATGGLHETLISTKVSYLMKKRARLTISTPPIPAATGGTDDVTGVRIYHGLGSTAPSDANMKRGLVDLPNGVSTATYSTVMDRSTSSNTGTPGPFPSSTPALVQSAIGGLLLGGDGSFAAPMKLQSRSHELVTGTGAATATKVITYDTAFPVGAIPSVTITSYNSPNFKAWTSSESNTGFTLNAARYDGATFATSPLFNWSAVAP
jgi:hypothetical protein